jgi:hypothetical protein
MGVRTKIVGPEPLKREFLRISHQRVVGGRVLLAVALVAGVVYGIYCYCALP